MNAREIRHFSLVAERPGLIASASAAHSSPSRHQSHQQTNLGRFNHPLELSSKKIDNLSCQVFTNA